MFCHALSRLLSFQATARLGVGSLQCISHYLNRFPTITRAKPDSPACVIYPSLCYEAAKSNATQIFVNHLRHLAHHAAKFKIADRRSGLWQVTVISMADFKRRQWEKAAVRDESRPFCGPCWDEHKEVHHLQRHKIWGKDCGTHCPNCWEEFDV